MWKRERNVKIFFIYNIFNVVHISTARDWPFMCGMCGALFSSHTRPSAGLSANAIVVITPGNIHSCTPWTHICIQVVRVCAQSVPLWYSFADSHNGFMPHRTVVYCDFEPASYNLPIWLATETDKSTTNGSEYFGVSMLTSAKHHWVNLLSKPNRTGTTDSQMFATPLSPPSFTPEPEHTHSERYRRFGMHFFRSLRGSAHWKLLNSAARVFSLGV